MARQRIDVKKAAQILGISTDAVHKRAKRGSLPSDKDPDGRVFVYLDDALDNGYTRLDDDVDDGYTQPDNGYTPPEAGGREDHRDELVEELRNRVRYLEVDFRDELVEELRSRVRYLEEESRRKDSILLTMAHRISELEAPSEPREATEKGSERVNVRVPSEPNKPRSWWSRLFGASVEEA